MPRKQIERAANENDHFSFSDDRWDELRRILGKYETGSGKGLSSNVNRFILEIELMCSLVDTATAWREYLDNQEKIDALIKHLRKALKILNPSAIDSSGKVKATERAPFKISAYPQTYYYETQEPAFSEILTKEQEFWKRANDATVPIMNLLSILDDSKRFMERKKRKKGQLPADYDGFVMGIAEEFQRYFGEKPTAHGDGAFAEVVRIALESLGRRSEYPDRLIRAAFKKLKVKYPL